MVLLPAPFGMGAAGVMAGGLYGAWHGAKGGYGYANKVMGKPSWEQDAKKDKDETPEKHIDKKASEPLTQDQINEAVRQAAMIGAKGSAAVGGTGAALGIAGAPKGYVTQGAVRGGIAGLGTGLGAIGGGLAGLGAGAAFSNHTGGDPIVPSLVGAGGGALLGGLAGHGLANAAMGKPGWEQNEEKEASFIPAPKRSPKVAPAPAMGNGVKPAQAQSPTLDYRYRATAPKSDFLGGYGRQADHYSTGAPTQAPKPSPPRDSFLSFRGSPMA